MEWLFNWIIRYIQFTAILLNPLSLFLSLSYKWVYIYLNQS